MKRPDPAIRIPGSPASRLIACLRGLLRQVACLPVLFIAFGTDSNAMGGTGIGLHDTRPAPDPASPGCLSLAPAHHTTAAEQALPEPDDCPQTVRRTPDGLTLLLLPDLQTRSPYDLQIDVLPGGGRELRLSNTIWNAGYGPLEMEGRILPALAMTGVEQHLATSSGQTFSHRVGEFVWHPTHDHWHFAGFSIYELWTLTPAGDLDRLASASDKISYCVIDTDRVDPALEGYSPYRRFTGCGQTLQGLSLGWGDTYKSHLDGQSIALDGVRDGFYALKSTANPDGLLLETDYHNNAAVIYLEIRLDHVARVSLGAYLDWTCQTAPHPALPCRV